MSDQDSYQHVEFTEERDVVADKIKHVESTKTPGMTGFFMKKFHLSKETVNILLLGLALIVFLVSIALFALGYKGNI